MTRPRRSQTPRLAPTSGRPFDSACTLCPRLVRYRSDVEHGPRPFGAFDRAAYHGAPVAPYGPEDAPLLIVGLAPGFHGANRTGYPFWKDFAGEVLYALLGEMGLARVQIGELRPTIPRPPILDGVRITNTVKCAPPGNKPATDEVHRCSSMFLRRELLSPDHRAVLAMGQIAFQAIFACLDQRAPDFGHEVLGQLSIDAGGSGLRRSIPVLATYHFSRLNMNTRRLTRPMAAAVLRKAATSAGIPG